jgi:hypothetical protein
LTLQSTPVADERASCLIPNIPKLLHAACQAMLTAAAGWAVASLLLLGCRLSLLHVIWHPMLLFHIVLLQL